MCTAFLLFGIWSKYKNLIYLITYFECTNKFAEHAYFPEKLEYVNKFQKHMPCGYFGACLPWWYFAVCHFRKRLTQIWTIVLLPARDRSRLGL